MTSSKEQRRALILNIVENQLRDNDPPETGQTLERLIASGISRDEAMRLVGCVVTTEIFEVLKQRRSFDLNRYVERLNALPALPWDDEQL